MDTVQRCPHFVQIASRLTPYQDQLGLLFASVTVPQLRHGTGGQSCELSVLHRTQRIGIYQKVARAHLPMPNPSAWVALPKGAQAGGANSSLQRASCRTTPETRLPCKLHSRSEEHTSELQSLRHLVC